MLKKPNISPYELRLKVGAVCSIMRNLAVDKGLIKNVRVVIIVLYTYYVVVNLVNASIKEIYYLPRIIFKFYPREEIYDVDCR